jgi:hypothetical protein
MVTEHAKGLFFRNQRFISIQQDDHTWAEEVRRG